MAVISGVGVKADVGTTVSVGVGVVVTPDVGIDVCNAGAQHVSRKISMV